MTIRAVVFDIGGVLEMTPDLGLTAKPDPRFFALACERLGVQPGEMVFLDDVEGHIAAANALGIHGIVFRNTAQAIADIKARLQAGQPAANG